MAGPYDYTIQQPDIAGSIAGGINTGLQLGAASQAAEAQAAATERHKQYSADLQNYLTKPTAQGASAMMAKYPESQKAMAASFDVYNKGQKEDIFKAGTQAYSAIQNGRPDLASSILDERIKAAENSGADTTDLVSLKQSLERDPRATGAGLALTMSALDPEGWSKIAGESREAALAPSKLTESQAKASKAATDAKFAESAAVQDLTKGGWEIQKLANDINISKLNSQIAAMNAETNRLDSGTKSEANRLKTDELRLKMQDKVEAREAAIRDKVATVETARTNIDNLNNTIYKALQTPADVIESVTGPISSRAPTLSQDSADFEEVINTLKSQAFLAQIPTFKASGGAGALSDAEGAKLESSLQSLSLRQSPKALTENLKEIQRLVTKGRDSLKTKYGVPDVVQDTPNAKPSPDRIESLVEQYTRGQ